METPPDNLFQQTARLYDFDFRDDASVDLPFLREYAERLGGPVLELGCGTGRVALALARDGHRVTGLDISESMLEIFREKLAAAPDAVRGRVDWIRGDMANFRLNRRFALVIAPFRAFQALIDDSAVHGCLRRVREHVSGGGRFIVNVFRPKSVLGEDWCFPEYVQWERDDPDTGRRIVKKQRGDRIDVARQTLHSTLTYEVTALDGAVQVFRESLSLRYWYREQMIDALMAGGFRIVEEYGGYDKGAVESGRELIFVASKEDSA